MCRGKRGPESSDDSRIGDPPIALFLEPIPGVFYDTWYVVLLLSILSRLLIWLSKFLVVCMRLCVLCLVPLLHLLPLFFTLFSFFFRFFFYCGRGVRFVRVLVFALVFLRCYCGLSTVFVFFSVLTVLLSCSFRWSCCRSLAWSFALSSFVCRPSFVFRYFAFFVCPFFCANMFQDAEWARIALGLSSSPSQEFSRGSIAQVIAGVTAESGLSKRQVPARRRDVSRPHFTLVCWF